jgi:hypothetical protein
LTYCSSLMRSRAVTLCVKRLPTSFLDCKVT